MIQEKEIANYKKFVDFLKSELSSFYSAPEEEWRSKATKCVNGLASLELRRLVNLETRRKYGTFFTDSVLARQVLNFLKPDFTKTSIVYDPACGAGNLLICVANYLFDKKINLEGNGLLLGTDIHEEFIEAAKTRLLMNELLLAQDNLTQFSNFYKSQFSIQLANSLQPNEFYNKATHIVINPPFNLMLPDEKLSWSRGKVSAAALFLDKVIEHVNPGTSIYAILPDVLRSGTRYEKWRNIIAQKCNSGKAKLLGQFDKHTDVDVFAIKLTKKKKTSFAIKPTVDTSKKPQRTIDDIFHVCVGRVVDYRDPHEGKRRGYVVSKGLKGWTENRRINLKRKHKGKAFESPFVVIKRTSRKGDAQRAVAAIINTPGPVYVDNHLIILKPKSGTLKDCYMALSNLKMTKTDFWLNDKIRCRHLTVKVVSKIPVWH